MLSAGCASGPDISGAPRHGIIVYFNPGTGISRTRTVKPKASALMYVSLEGMTDREGSDTPLGMKATVGRRDPNKRPDWSKRYLDKRIRNPNNLADAFPVEISEEVFARLWAALEETGLFKLPQYPGRTPPNNRAYFVLDDTETQRIFTRPEGTMAADLEFRKAWAKATQVIVGGEFTEGLYRTTKLSNRR